MTSPEPAAPADFADAIACLTGNGASCWSDGLTGLEAMALAACGLLAVLLLAGTLLGLQLWRRNRELNRQLGRLSRRSVYTSVADPLTGLPNRQRLEEVLASGVLPVPGALPGGSLWLIVMNLNGMRLIGDARGPRFTDQLFRIAARRLGHALEGKPAMVARLDRDAFGVLVQAADNDAVASLAASLFEVLGQPCSVGGEVIRLRASAGITQCQLPGGEPHEWLRQAELAMAQARHEGNDAWAFHDPSFTDAVNQRFQLRIELQAAIDAAQFVLHYQPVVDVATGTIAAVEAQLYWAHPQRGLLHPGEFIRVAEDTGLIVPISNWEIEQACHDMRLLRNRHHVDFPVAVSVSPRHFRRNEFVSVVRDALERYHLPAGALDIQLTEGVIFVDTGETTTRLNAVRELGVGIGIDDFGIGYSSLDYLKALPIDKIKVDRTFVRDIVSNRRDASITRSIIALAHDLNMKVVAEGVQTDSQFWFLKRNFCDQVQGQLIAQPGTLEQLGQLLLEQAGRVALPRAGSEESSGKVLLLVDDEANILRALSRVLRRDGYHILTATSPRHAFSLLAENDVQVVLSDQRMPEMTGTEFFSRVKEMYPETVRLVLSGYTDLKSVTDAINRGSIYRFLTKPWDDEELRREVAEAFNAYEEQAL